MTPAAHAAPISRPNFTANFKAMWTQTKKLNYVNGGVQEIKFNYIKIFFSFTYQWGYSGIKNSFCTLLVVKLYYYVELELKVKL